MSENRPVYLFTDFGYAGPYVGQMTGAILAVSPDLHVVNLMHDAPAMQPWPAAYLLAACCNALPAGAVVVAVVDPGVGGERDALVVHTPGLKLVGPDNGLMSRVPGITAVDRIDWRPEVLSASFHGRDLFGPVGAMLAAGHEVAHTTLSSPDRMQGGDWPQQVPEVVYIDAYGNLMTGLSGVNFNKNKVIQVSGRMVPYAGTFSRVPAGEAFWYVNSLGLVEIAVNRGSAAASLSLALGDRILLD